MFSVPVWPQQWWKGCANGSNVVTLRFGDLGTKGMLGAVSFKLYATTLNNTQQHVIWCAIGRNNYVICSYGAWDYCVRLNFFTYNLVLRHFRPHVSVFVRKRRFFTLFSKKSESTRWVFESFLPFHTKTPTLVTELDPTPWRNRWRTLLKNCVFSVTVSPGYVLTVRKIGENTLRFETISLKLLHPRVNFKRRLFY